MSIFGGVTEKLLARMIRAERAPAPQQEAGYPEWIALTVVNCVEAVAFA